MTKIIGLTGGIGSGKTTVAKAFEKFGVPVYIADDEGRKITDSPEVLKKLIVIFGNEIVSNGILDRKKLAAIVFQNPEKLQQLNAIIHPLVKEHFKIWLQNHQNAKFIIRETAILFESGSYKDCDKIITVTAPIQTRIERVVLRDKTTPEDVLKRIQNQWTDEQRIALSDFVIHNLAPENTSNQINVIFEKLAIL